MRFAIKDAGNITFYNRKTGVPAFYTEDANSFEFKLSADTVYAKAKGNKAIAFNGEITCDLKVDYEVIQFAQLSIMMASDVVESKKAKVARQFKGKVNGEKKVIIPQTKAVAGSLIAFKLKEDGQEFAQKLEFTTQTQSADTELTITTPGINENDLVAVFYQVEKAKMREIIMTADGNSPAFRIEADVAALDTDMKKVALHLSIKNAKAKRNAELSFSAENPSKFPMELDCFPDEMGQYAVLSYLDDDETGEAASLAERLDIDLTA